MQLRRSGLLPRPYAAGTDAEGGDAEAQQQSEEALVCETDPFRRCSKLVSAVRAPAPACCMLSFIHLFAYSRICSLCVAVGRGQISRVDPFCGSFLTAEDILAGNRDVVAALLSRLFLRSKRPRGRTMAEPRAAVAAGRRCALGVVCVGGTRSIALSHSPPSLSLISAWAGAEAALQVLPPADLQIHSVPVHRLVDFTRRAGPAVDALGEGVRAAGRALVDAEGAKRAWLRLREKATVRCLHAHRCPPRPRPSSLLA